MLAPVPASASSAGWGWIAPPLGAAQLEVVAFVRPARPPQAPISRFPGPSPAAVAPSPVTTVRRFFRRVEQDRPVPLGRLGPATASTIADRIQGAAPRRGGVPTTQSDRPSTGRRAVRLSELIQF